MFTVKEILTATGGELLSGSGAAKIEGVSTDTRTVKRGELFIAIIGTKYDGHSFAADALKKGAAGILVSSKKLEAMNLKELKSAPSHFIIKVSDTLRALGDIALFHRKRFDIPMVAVTGSNGKTTAKEMIERVLRKEWAPLKNRGTENNLVGVPMTLLRLTERHESAVIELGMNRIGEIERLAELTAPNVGVITNIGPSHLEYLKDLNGVYRAKKELLDFLGKGDIAVLNSDDKYLRSFKKRPLKIVTFGIERKSVFQAKNVKRERGGWRFETAGFAYFIPLEPYHDIYNALCAIAIGELFNVGNKEIMEALANYRPLEKRMSRIVFKDIEFIDDTYNSNPASMQNAVRTLAEYGTSGKKILISGDMLELGEKSSYYHKKIGEIVARSGIDSFITVGKLMQKGFLSAKKCGMENAWFCSSKEEAVNILNRIVRPDDIVLVKGSRATQMEDVIRCFITCSTR